MTGKIIRAMLSRINGAGRTLRRYWINTTNVGVRLERGVEVFGNVRISVTDGGYLHIKSNTTISSGTNITVQTGRIDIGNNVFIGIGTVIVAKESIKIGDDALIAEYVVIRDQDHRYESSPINDAGFHTSPIGIGNDVWIGCKATILRGVTIGEHSVVAAHAVVNEDAPAGVIVAGIPARIIKKIS